MTNETDNKTTGDNIQVGDISSSIGVAIGHGASAQVSIENYHEAPKEITFPLHQLPPANHNFTGRTDLLIAIQHAFNNDQSSIAITQAIAGLGGVGKTQLALAYAYAHRDSYDLMWWLNAEGEPTLNESMIGLGRALGPPVDNMERPAAIQAIHTWITSTDKRWLLVYDNVDNLEPHDLRPYLPGGRGHALITSRNPHWGGTAQVLNVNVFTPGEAVAFFEARFGQAGGQARAEYEALAEELGYLPLALEHAAAYMETRGKTATDYLRLFKAQRPAVLARTTVPDAYHATITTTWQIAFDYARKTPGAADLLNLCCFLAPDDIPLAVIEEQAKVLPEDLAAVVADELALDDALKALTRYSLLTMQNGVLNIHRLVQAVARDQMGEERKKEWVEAAVKFMKQAFPFEQNDLSTWERSRKLLPHIITVSGLADEQKLIDNDIASLFNQLGIFFNSKGDYRSGFKQMERALAIREKALGLSHPDTALSLSNLGALLQATGQLSEAQPYHERALAIREKALGLSHPDTAQSLNNLGGLLESMGQLNEARSYYERALAINEEALGSSHQGTALTLNNLGSVLKAMGQLSEARSYYERALAIKEKALGPSHPDTALTLNNLGSLLKAMGQLSEARSYYERALAINEEALGPSHPNTALTLNNLGYLLKAIGQLGEARTYYERALAIKEEALGLSHPDTARTLNNLGSLLQAMGHLSEAQSYYERALAIREETLGASHPDTAQSLNNIGSLLQLMGQLSKARSYYEQALAIREEALGVSHPDTAQSLNNLAILNYYEGDKAEAARFMQQALTIWESSLGPDHLDSQRSRQSLAIIVSKLGK